MRKLITFTILLGLSIIFAEPKNDSLKVIHGFGFSGGPVSGVGITYKYLPGDEKLIPFIDGLQFVVGGYSNGRDDEQNFHQVGTFTDTYNTSSYGNYSNSYIDYEYGKETYLSLGFTLIKMIHEGKNSRFYGFAGIHDMIEIRAEYQQKISRVSISGDQYTTQVATTYSEPEKKNTNEHTIMYGAGIGLEWALTKHIRFSLEIPVTIMDDNDIMTYIPQGGIYYFF